MGNNPPSRSSSRRSPSLPPPPPSSPPLSPPIIMAGRPLSQHQAVALKIESPIPVPAAMLPAISITSRSPSPPPLPTTGGGGASSPSSLRATPPGSGMFRRGNGSTMPASPRSAASRASTVTSFADEQEQEQSYFWARMKGQYQERKTARRQSMLGTASKLGRPCRLAIQSITLQGAFPPEAQVHVEVSLLPGEYEQNLLSSPLPPLATPARLPVAAGETGTQHRVDIILLPSVTSTSTLLLTVRLDDGHALASLRYPLADITVALRPTELRLTPTTHGKGAQHPRSRSPSTAAGARSSSPLSFVRRRSESPKPASAAPTHSPVPSPPATGAAEAASEARPLAPLPTLGAVWGELSFFDNRTSGVGWVEVLEELGTPVKQRRLLLVTPPTFALLESPACTLGFTGYPLIHVSHVEPGRLPPPPSSKPHDAQPPPAHGGGDGGPGAGFVTITLCRAETPATPRGGQDIVLMVEGGEEEARRWTQMLKRAAHEASYGGDDS